MPKNIRIRRGLVLAASLGAMAVAAPAAHAVDVKVVERPGADELQVTARAGVNDNLSVQAADGVRMTVRSFSPDTIALAPGSGCTHTDLGTFKEAVCNAGAGDRLNRAVVNTGDLADQLTINVPKGLVRMGSGDDVLRSSAFLGGPLGTFAVFGDAGNDRITDSGSQGAVIVGGTGNDVLRGGSAINRIEGGLGVDEISGGGGADTIRVARDNNASDFVTCGDQVEALVEADRADRLSVNCDSVTRI